MRRIYLDNAATTPLSTKVIEAMMDVMENHYGNPSSIHHYGRLSKNLIEESRKIIAQDLKASLGEIFFTSSATEAINTILRNLVTHQGIKKIITTRAEHHCVTHTLDYLKQLHEVDITFLDLDQRGNINYESLEHHLADHKNVLVALMYGNNEIGTKHDTEKISELCTQHKALFLCDTVQAVAKCKIDVSKTKYSFITGSAHKFHGPKGVGFFYMNSDNIIPPMLHGGAQERNMRAGTENLTGIVGMGAAFKDYIEHRDERKAHISTLRQQFKQGLIDIIPEVIFLGNQDSFFLPHVLSVSFPPHPKNQLLMFNLDIAGIAASAGSACSSGIEKDSDVLEAIKLPKDRKAVRFSFSYMNTSEEIDIVLSKIKDILS